MKSKSIAFVLPGTGIHPVGGFKVAYEYANKFAENGNKVAIFYTMSFKKRQIIKNIYRFIVYYIFKKYSCKKWFDLKNEIKEFLLFYGKEKIKFYDTICVTAVQTAYDIYRMDDLRGKKILYLIQDYEKWNDITDDFLIESYKFPFSKIVISDWLQKIVESTGEKSTLIYNGFDFDYFQMTTPIEDRNPLSIGMLYHLDDRKRCEDSFKALDIVKEKYPNLCVNIFGVPKRPKNLPDWYNYIQRPNRNDHNKIYNNSSIFIAASKAEGMALPPAEAMICGCALVCTNISGFSMYAINGQTALTSNPLDPVSLANNIIKLIENNELRINIAKSGNKFIKKFTWENAYEKFKALI